MGYNSRIFIVDVTHVNVFGLNYDSGTELASIEMGCMPHSFHELFDKETDFRLAIDEVSNYDKPTDCYGKRLAYADKKKVNEWLMNEMKTNNYRRLPLLNSILNGIDESLWNSIRIVHYGW